MRGKILIVDDELPVRNVIGDGLTLEGFEVVGAGDCRSAERTFISERPDGAIIDYYLPDGNALELLPRLRAVDADVPAIILTGFGSIDLAVRAIKEGADHFLTKPVKIAALAVIVQRLLTSRQERRRHLAGVVREKRDYVDPFLGASSAIRHLAQLAQRALTSDSIILLKGDTGTGKGVLARWLHENGPRADEPFVDVNCAGLTREFLETELFGHEKGAFTGATALKKGLLEVADRGTVFLDEIGDIDMHVQPKLLKVIEEKRFRRLGCIADRQVDVRMIMATHQDLSQLVKEKRFRSDLFYRITAIVIDVPSLKERREDIVTLSRFFLERLAARLGHDNIRLLPEAEKALTRYSWPGNIRELRNILERAILLANDSVISVENLGLGKQQLQSPVPLSNTTLTLEELEHHYIETILSEERGHIEVAARRLGIHRSSLYNKIKKYGIFVPRSS